MPYLSVCIRDADLGLTSYTKDGLVDTGADTTIVPLEWLDQVEAAVEGHAVVHGLWGGVRSVNAYVVDVIVEGITFPGVVVIADETDDDVLLGRDVLNRMKIVLDGFKEQIEIAGY